MATMKGRRLEYATDDARGRSNKGFDDHDSSGGRGGDSDVDDYIDQETERGRGQGGEAAVGHRLQRLGRVGGRK